MQLEPLVFKETKNACDKCKTEYNNFMNWIIFEPYIPISKKTEFLSKFNHFFEFMYFYSHDTCFSLTNHDKYYNIRKKLSSTFKNEFKRGKGCAQCNSTENLEVDHITPLCLNGTNDINNLQVLCKYHNTRKGKR